MAFCGEYFLFYGLIDFMLFLVLAWRNGSFVSEIFFVFFYLEYLALVPSATDPVQQLIFLIVYFRWREGVPLPFWGPSQSFGFYLLPPGQAIFLGLLDVTQVPFFTHQVTMYKHLFFHSDLDLLLWDWPTFLWCLNVILCWLALLIQTRW